MSAVDTSPATTWTVVAMFGLVVAKGCQRMEISSSVSSTMSAESTRHRVITARCQNNAAASTAGEIVTSSPVTMSRSTRRIGYRLMSYFWLRVEPARLEEVGMALAEHPPISFEAATTGPFNLVAAAITRGTNDLYRYLTDGVGHLPAIQAIETAPAVRQIKRLV